MRSLEKIDTSFITDDRLSWKAKGLLMYFLIHPDKWHTSIGKLEHLATDRETSISSGLKELEDCGYLLNVPVKNDQGRTMYYRKDYLDHSILDAKQA